MLKKRTAIPAIFAGSLLLAPGLSQASPLSWMQGVDVVAKMTRLWTLFPGLGHTATKPAAPVKNGVGIDPQGQPIPTSEPGSGATTSSTGAPGTGI